MKTLLTSGLALAIMTGGAFAQTAAPIRRTRRRSRQFGLRFRFHRPRALIFAFEDGDAAVDVKCADDEPMKPCADITLQILDKLVSLPRR